MKKKIYSNEKWKKIVQKERKNSIKTSTMFRIIRIEMKSVITEQLLFAVFANGYSIECPNVFVHIHLHIQTEYRIQFKYEKSVVMFLYLSIFSVVVRSMKTTEWMLKLHNATFLIEIYFGKHFHKSISCTYSDRISCKKTKQISIECEFAHNFSRNRLNDKWKRLHWKTQNKRRIISIN